MKIYIPSHLRSLRLVDQMCKMIEKYQESYKSTVDPYYYYYTSLDYDPVKKFLGICLANSNKPIDEVEIIINYLTNLFYCVVGGKDKIFEYLKNYVGIKIINVDYSIEDYSLSIKMGELPNSELNSEEFFKSSFEEFIKRLLIVSTVSVKIDSDTLKIEESVSYEIRSEASIYNKVTYTYSDEEIII